MFYGRLGTLECSFSSLGQDEQKKIALSPFWSLTHDSPYIKHLNWRTVKPIIMAALPFVLLFCVLGFYNYACFGNFLDFGATYNITTNDMTLRGFNLDRIFSSMFVYLFQLPIVSISEPYLGLTDAVQGYFGRVISEGMCGGLFCLTPILLIVWLLLLKQIRAQIDRITKDNVLKKLAWVSFGSALVLIVFDSNGAGILVRYFLDFGFLFPLRPLLCSLRYSVGVD